MQNIIWKRPDNSIAVTWIQPAAAEVEVDGAVVTVDATPASAEYSASLQARGDVPPDWVAVAVDIEVPAARDFRDAWAWITPEPVVDICPNAAREVTKARLRAERAPLFAPLDVAYWRAIEAGDAAGMQAAAEAKQRLRDLPDLADAVAAGDLDGLRALKA